MNSLSTGKMNKMNAPNSSPEDVGARIRSVRKMAGHTQTKMAEVIGSSWSSISKIEIGAKGISSAMLNRIADAYGVSNEWLANGTGGNPSRDAIADAIKKPMPHTVVRYRDGSQIQLPKDWRKLLNDAVEAKGDLFESVVNDFGVPVLEAFSAVTNDFVRRVSEKS